MARAKVSQAEARRLRVDNRELRRRIGELERKISRFRYVSYDGKEIASEQSTGGAPWAIATANTLGHVVMAKQYNGKITYYALPLPSEGI